MVLTDPLEILQGSFSFIFVVISVIIGLKIISKYFEHKNKTLILVGFAWIGLGFPWMPDSINFMMLLFSNNQLSEFWYLFIGNAFLLIFLSCWILAYLELKNPDKQKLFLIVAVIIFIIFEITFLSLLFSDTSLIGTSLGPFHYEFSLFIEIYLALIILSLLITGILFALESFKSSNPEIKLKGRFILIAFVLFATGAVLDSIVELTPATVVITRVILILSSISFYLGFILPDFVKKAFIK